MTRQIVLSMAVVAALLACWPHPAQARSWGRNWDFSLDGGRGAERCSDLQARTSRELAQAT
ncbi:MAG: hypothetical protein LAP40_16650 [Acidobacteriia bacterium]|nr:hypothetical protein [Terriglobia bacterium]